MGREAEHPARTIFPPSGKGKRLAVRALRAYARTLRKPSAPFPGPGDAPIKILIQTMGGIGNSLMATPLIDATRAAYPQARIDVLTTPGAAQLFQAHPSADQIVADQDGDDKRRGGFVSLNRMLGAAHYDVALLTLNAVTFRFAVRSVLARVPRRVIHGYAFEPWDDYTGAFTDRVDRNRGIHDVEDNVNLLRAIAGDVPPPGTLSLHEVEEDGISALGKLKAAGWKAEGPTVALCPGSSGWMSFKRWPLERYMALASRVLKDSPTAQVVVFSGPEEESERADWRSRFEDDRFTLVHGLSLREYPQALRHMSVAVANDSLPMHLCAVVQTPVVALFGPTHPSQTGPWRCPGKVITPPAPFEAYFRIPYPLDPDQFPNLMERIEVDTVYDGVCEFLD